MPNIWTHNLFGDAAAKQTGTQDWLDKPELKQIYHLGCQGPDFLFYHRFFPWQGKSLLNTLGSRMHQEACGPALLLMADTVKQAKAAVNDPLTVYVMGFMMHHVLDRNMHPYVFCKSGSAKWDHQRFEVIIDTLVVRKLLNLETWATPAWKQIDIGHAFPPSIVKMLAEIVIAHYPDLAGQISAEDWNRAYRDMILAQKLFHDPYGIKRVLTFGQIEPLVYKRRNPERDYLNEARAPWRHPAVEEETSTASFWDLWEEAMEDALRVWHAAFQYWNSADTLARETLAEALGNRSYEHGKPVDAGISIRYEEPIW